MEVTIITEELSPVFKKHHVKGLPFDASFNEFTEPDTGDPHDHPFGFITHILSGGYIEEMYDAAKREFVIHHRNPGTSHLVKATDIHRIIELPTGHCVTLMLPQSGHIRKSGFYRFENGKVYRRDWDEKEFKLYKL
jgi:hypothetical protein